MAILSQIKESNKKSNKSVTCSWRWNQCNRAYHGCDYQNELHFQQMTDQSTYVSKSYFGCKKLLLVLRAHANHLIYLLVQPSTIEAKRLFRDNRECTTSLIRENSPKKKNPEKRDSTRRFCRERLTGTIQMEFLRHDFRTSNATILELRSLGHDQFSYSANLITRKILSAEK